MLFQIKVALVGKVSVGKSTVLNATLRGNHSKMHWDRETVAEHQFQLLKSNRKKRKTCDTSNMDTSPRNRSQRAAALAPGHGHREADTEVIVVDERTRETWKHVPEEKQGDRKGGNEAPNGSADRPNSVEILKKRVNLPEEHFFGGGVSMREDTELILIDLPGLDDPDCEDELHAHVEARWSDFDGVIVVLDAERPQTVKNFLRYIKQNWVDCMKKGVPLFILANKVDNPWSEGAKEKLDGIYKSVENVFGVNDCVGAIEQALTGAIEPQYPLVLPISAERAFLYHSARVMTAEEFKEIPMEMVERVASAEIGAFCWEEASRHEKYKLAHTVIKEKKLFEKRLGSTNFDKFMKLFAMTFCQDVVQATVIDRQIDFELKSLNPSTNMVEQIMKLYDKKKLLGQDTASLSECFWAHYSQLADSIFASLQEEGPRHVSELGKLFDLLVNFHKFAAAKGLPDEKGAVVEEMKLLVSRQFDLLLERFKATDLGSSRANISKSSSGDPWNVSGTQWYFLLSSLSYRFYDETLNRDFYKQAMVLDQLRCSLSVETNDFMRESETQCCHTNPSNWGYVAWKYGAFVESLAHDENIAKN